VTPPYAQEVSGGTSICTERSLVTPPYAQGGFVCTPVCTQRLLDSNAHKTQSMQCSSFGGHLPV